MQAAATLTDRDLRHREGVKLIRTTGIDAMWSMPVALWHAPHGFDTRERPDYGPCHVIAWRLSGGSVQRYGPGPGRYERLPADGFSVHPACNELRFLAPSEINYAHIYATEEFLRNVLKDIASSAAEYSTIVREEKIMYRDQVLGEQIADYIRRAFDAVDPPSPLEMESRANLIAIQFLKRHSPNPSVSDRATGRGRLANWQVRRACDFMEENLANTVSLSEIAGLVGMSPEHFCRAFHRTTGQPPHRWMRARRMDRARELLLRTDASLTGIAQQLGYAGQSAFGAAFRRVTGMTPSEYRRTGS